MSSPEANATSLDPASVKLRLVKQTEAAPKLNALEREFLSPLLEIQETPPSPHQRAVLWTIVALVVVMIAWASVGKMAVVSTAPGKFIPDGRVKQIQPLESSTVKAIHVTEGQHVSPGDLLIELDPTLSAAAMGASEDKYSFNKLEQQRLAAELTHGAQAYATAGSSGGREELENRMRRAREQAHATKLAQARAAVDEKAAAFSAAQATLQKFNETNDIAQERESNARPLVDTGAIARSDYLQLKEDLARNRNDLASQQKTVEQARSAVIEARQALEQVERDRVADIYKDLDQQVAGEPELKGEMEKTRELYALKWLRAPVSGFVQKVDVATIGQVVSPAQSLVTIVPDDLPLIVEAAATNQDVGYLKIGQPVDVKVDTFPFQKYGTLKGTLVWISPDAEEKVSASSDPDTRAGANSDNAQKDRDRPDAGNLGYVYKVHVRTERSQFQVDGQLIPVKAGMTVQADITTDKRRVIDFFLSPVIKYLDEGLKVR